MALHAELAVVFIAGLITALATGVGALPFFFFEDISDRWNVLLWGLASGIMVSASVFGLLGEGLSASSGFPWGMVLGAAAGVALVVVGHEVLEGAEIDPKEYEEADVRKLVLVLGILTVHSFPEGVAIGVSFADLAFDVPGTRTLQLAGMAVPLLAVFMTVAISIHNVPEGTAISIPLRSMDVGEWRMAWWAVFSSRPQPIGAAVASAFVSLARAFLPFGFGFAAGAMIYLVLTEFIPEARELGAGLPNRGTPELVGGIVVGVAVMVPLAFVQV
jgi:ZIP family zinc transporter